MGDAAAPVPGEWRREVLSFIELFALRDFAITQPLLDLFGRGVEQFALRGASGGPDRAGAAFAMVFDDRYLVPGRNEVQLYRIA